MVIGIMSDERGECGWYVDLSVVATQNMGMVLGYIEENLRLEDLYAISQPLDLSLLDLKWAIVFKLTFDWV